MEEDKITAAKEKLPVPTQLRKLQESLSRGKTVIGVDIGSSSVNVAQSAVYQGKPTLIKAVVEDIGIVSEEERSKVVIEALKRALSQFNTSHAEIVCTISNQKTLVDYITMPIMPDAELAQAVKLEINNSPRFSVENPVMDFKVAGRIKDSGVEKINIMVAVSAKSALDSLLSHFKPLEKDPLAGLKKTLLTQDLMGLNLQKIIPTSLALENIIKKSKSKIQETIVTLQIGSMSAELNVYRNESLEFSRKINVTGLDFTRCLTSALSTSTGKVELSLQEAEWLKKEYGIPSASEEYLIKGKITANQAISLLRPRLEQLIKEIVKSFDLYYDKNREGKIDRLVLFGGGAVIKRLPEFLNAELGLPVSLGNSLQDVDLLFEDLLDTTEEKQRLILAIGASLADHSGINLLPESLRETQKKFFQKLLVIIFGIVLVMVSASLYVMFLIKRDEANKQLEKAKGQYQVLLPRLNAFKDKLLMHKMLNHRFDMGALLKELSYLSDKIYLTGLELKDEKLVLSGFVMEDNREAKKSLTLLVDDLKKFSLSDAKILMMKTDKAKTKTTFTVDARLVGSGL